MEKVDVVDERDNVIGVSTKSQTHKDGSIHRVVSVIAKTFDYKIIVQKRTDNGKLDHSVGGHVRAGESYLEAVIREAYEELLLKGSFKMVGTVLADERNNTNNIRHMFCVHEFLLPRDWQFQKTKEAREILIMPIEEVLNKMKKNRSEFSSGFVFTLKKYLELTSA